MPIVNRFNNRKYSAPWGYDRAILGFSNSRSVEVVEIIMKSGQKTKPHYHKEVEELFYLIDGSATVIVEGEPIHLVKGDFLAVTPPEKHQIIAGDEGVHLIAIKTPGSEKDRIFLE